MVFLTGYIMPSDKEQLTGSFIPQSVFAVNGLVILMGLLKNGELALDTETLFNDKVYKLIDIQVFNKHVKSIKATDGGAQGIGIVLTNNSIDEAQEMTNKELLFK